MRHPARSQVRARAMRRSTLVGLVLLLSGCSSPFESACEKVDRLSREEAENPVQGEQAVRDLVEESSDAIEECLRENES